MGASGFPSSTADRVRRAICLVAEDPEAVELHHQIRHEVFVRQERLFPAGDRDERDHDPDTVKLLGLWDRLAVGAGRIYPRRGEAGLWQGDRRAVLRDHRQHGVGLELVHFAVEQVRARGGRELMVQIPIRAAPVFEGLGWRRVGDPTIYVGVPHQEMRITIRATPG